MKLTQKQVQHVTKLANLPLTEPEEEKFASQLSAILNYISQLNKANTDKVDPTFNVTGLSNMEMSDQEKTCLPQEETLKNAPNKKDGYFVTKGIFEEG